MTVTQAVIFDKSIFDTSRARRWLKIHHFEPIKHVHETSRYLRYIIKEPNENYEYRTKQISDGIKIIVGIPFYEMY